MGNAQQRLMEVIRRYIDSIWTRGIIIIHRRFTSLWSPNASCLKCLIVIELMDGTVGAYLHLCGDHDESYVQLNSLSL